MCDSKSLLALYSFRDSYILVIHNITLYRERQDNQFPIYPVPKFHVADKVLVRNHIRGMWNPKYDVVSVIK